MVMKKKLYFFLPLFGIACNLSVAVNTDTPSIAFRWFNLFRESVLLLTAYFIVTKWWLVAKWKNLFFSLNSRRERERSCYFQILAWPFSLPFTCDVSHHVTWIGTFSKWPSIKRQKKWLRKTPNRSAVNLHRLYPLLAKNQIKIKVAKQKIGKLLRAYRL